VLEVATGNLGDLEVTGLGHDGLLPKLDLFMLAEHSFRVAGGARTRLPAPASLSSLLPPRAAELIKFWQQSLHKQLPGSQRYLEKLAQLASFVGRQASGVAGGAHAECKRYGVDAVTVRTNPDAVRCCEANVLLLLVVFASATVLTLPPCAREWRSALLEAVERVPIASRALQAYAF
jgi:Gaa1-like, GPI transamidase component